jgi:hypothetical protein
METGRNKNPEFIQKIGCEGATITFPHLSLNIKNPSFKLEIMLNKRTINMKVGDSYATQDVFIDEEVQEPDLVSQAKMLSVHPEKLRAKLLVNLLKNNFKTATQLNINKLRTTDPAYADWVEENVSERSQKKYVPFSEIVKHGHGICTHHSAIYLWLAQEAGLKGAIMRSDQNTITNIIRSDNGKKMFNFADVGANVVSHAWVELLLENGEWLPVDPTTGLVGDTQTNLEMFKQANYVCDTFSESIISCNVEPKNSVDLRERKISVPAGQISGIMSLKYVLASTLEKIVKPSFFEPSKVLPPTNEPYEGEMVISVQTGDCGDAAYTINNVAADF